MKGVYTKTIQKAADHPLGPSRNIVVGMIYTMGRNPTLITHIWAHPDYRDQRYASGLLAEVLLDADREGQQLMLSIQPDPGGMTWLQLAEWYKRCGFVPSRLADFYEDGDSTMTRSPSSP
jgi:ribosomal protein S18 acetylase RimI-like enzyme